MQKTVYFIISSLRYSQLQSSATRIVMLFFKLTLNLKELALTRKKQAFVIPLCLKYIIHSKILQSDQLKAFQSRSQGPHFFQICDLYRKKAQNVNFHYRPNTENVNDQIFQYPQKPLFFGHFEPYLAFLLKCHSVKHNCIYRFLFPNFMPKFRKKKTI